MAIKREQTVSAESQLNTRQDRNSFITDGGVWRWDSGTGRISWFAGWSLQAPQGAISVTGPGSVTGMTTPGDALVVQIDRDVASAAVAATASAMSASLLTDTALVVGTRGTDGKFYFRNGTVMSDGDAKAFGTLNAVTDRTEVTSTGISQVSTVFTYVESSNQLAVYVGGVLLIKDTHYKESVHASGYGNYVTFSPGFVPPSSEIITFLNVVGGQGPSGSASTTLQEAYLQGADITLEAGNSRPLTIKGSSAADSTIATKLIDNAGTLVGATSLGNTPGSVLAGSSATGKGYFIFSDNKADASKWYVGPLNDTSGDALVGRWDATAASTVNGITLRNTDGAIEFGSYTPLSVAEPVLGGAWAGKGTLRWEVYSGTFDGAAAAVTIAVPAATVGEIAGAAIRINTASLDVLCSSDITSGTTEFYVLLDSGGNQIKIAGNLAGTGAVGSSYASQAFTLVVFYGAP